VGQPAELLRKRTAHIKATLIDERASNPLIQRMKRLDIPVGD